MSLMCVVNRLLNMAQISSYMCGAWLMVFVCLANAEATSNQTIRAIYIDNQNVFDLDNSEEDGGFYRVVNSLHIVTRKSVIQKQLLFKVGDRFEPNLIKESERILRSNRYLRDAKITVKSLGEVVDIFVQTKDTWSTKPTISYDKKADSSRSKIGLSEDNLLGRGVRSSVEFIDGPERNSLLFKIQNSNIYSSRYDLDLIYAANTDGDQKAITLDRPFYELSSRHAQGILFDEVTEENSLYDREGAFYTYESFIRRVQLYKGWSRGEQNGRVFRHKFGLRSDLQEHKNGRFRTLVGGEVVWLEDPLQEIAIPENKDNVTAFYAVEYLEDDFIKTSNFEKIGRTEDRYIGEQASLELGYTIEGEENVLQIDLSYSDTAYFSERFSVGVLGDLQFDVANGKVKNSVFGIEGSAYIQQSNKWQFYVDSRYDQVANFSYRKQLFLGGATGLRGYPEHFLSGQKSTRLTLEQRYFSDWSPWRIFNVGAAVFADIGKVSGDSDIDRMKDTYYSDIGFGLRLANNRSSRGNIIHFDFAIPLNARDEIGSYQFSMTAKRTF